MLRFTIISAFLLGSLSLGGGWFYFADTDPEPGLVVEEPHRDLATLPADREQEHEIEYLVHNRTRRTLRVVGADYG